MQPTNTVLNALDPEVQMLNNGQTEGDNYYSRRSIKLKRNYEMYRGEAPINRLVQRQTVHVPFMKQQVSTLMANVDDMPGIYFENLDNDKQKEVYLNAYWDKSLEHSNMEIKDVVDKKQNIFTGRTYDQMQIIDGYVTWNIVDTDDIRVNRFIDPTNIDSVRHFIHNHIYTPLSVIEGNKDYNQEAVKDIKLWFGTEMGLIKSAENRVNADMKAQRMADLGVLDAFQPVMGETVVELSNHIVMRRERKESDGTPIDEFYLYVLAQNMKILMKKPLEEIYGVTEDHYWRNHIPYNSWADDVDLIDWFTDGKADILYPINEILDVWFSQLVENRTLRSMGMHFYNSNLEGYSPQTWLPIPFGAYGIPLPENGNIEQNIQRVQIEELAGSIEEMKYVQELGQQGTGATATAAGQQTERQITFGEIKLAYQEAKGRLKGTSKFYVRVWQQRAYKFNKMIEGRPDLLDDVEIFKKGNNTNDIYSQTIGVKDIMSKKGYRVRIWSKEDKDSEDMHNIEKMQIVANVMQGNEVVIEEYQRKLLELAKFTPEKVVAALEIEKKKREAMALAATNAAAMGATPGAQPLTPGAGTPTMKPTMPQLPVPAQPGA